MANLTYEDYKNKITMQDILEDAGYILNRRDGLRYPSYIRIDSDGKRVRGDKYIVTQNGQCCFKPPFQKSYNIISFIKENPELFKDYSAGMNSDRLVNLVCCRLLNTPVDERESTKVREQMEKARPFTLEDYSIHEFEGNDRESQKKFYPFFKSRGIDLNTQYAFRKSFVLTTIEGKDGRPLKNLSFPMQIPGKEGIVGFEQRGFPNKDGKSYKGMAAGSNASEGLWVASPRGTTLQEAKNVYVFESAYDAMAYYQLHQQKDRELKNAVFISTGGNPGVGQMQGILRAGIANYHLYFDNDMVGRQFVANFESVALKEKQNLDKLKELNPGNQSEVKMNIFREAPDADYKDWNDMLLDKKQYSLTDQIDTGIDEDGDGINETIDKQEEIEETRQSFGRKR